MTRTAGSRARLEALGTWLAESSEVLFAFEPSGRRVVEASAGALGLTGFGADAIAGLTLERLLTGGGSDAFNVGTGTGHSVLEVVQAVEEVTGKTVPRIMGPRRDGDSPALVANSGKLKQSLGWKPKYDDLRRIVETAWRFDQKSAKSH